VDLVEHVGFEFAYFLASRLTLHLLVGAQFNGVFENGAEASKPSWVHRHDWRFVIKERVFYAIFDALVFRVRVTPLQLTVWIATL